MINEKKTNVYKLITIVLLLSSCSQISVWSQFFVPPFRDGEKLEYLLHYGPINGGMAKLTVRLSTIDKQPVFHARAEARTIGIADKIYRVKDIYESYIDVSSGLPLKAVRNISEGRYTYYDENFFNRDSNTVSSMKVGTMKVPQGIIDMVSAIYLLRNYNMDNLQVGDTIKLVTYFANEIYPLNLRYKGKEIIRTRFGKFRCKVFAPVTEVGRVFKTQDDMLMWISDDKNFLPLRIDFDMWVGSMRVDLVAYENLRYELKPLEK